jgi:CheY-like chemotaxis protein
MEKMEVELIKIIPELIKLIPSLLWLLFLVTVFSLFYRPIRDELLPNLTSFKVGGVELSFVRKSIDAAIELAQKSPQWEVNISVEDKEQALRRTKEHLAIFRGAQILWVDDHPENNLNERRMFRQLKADVDTVKSTDEALSMLQKGNYDLVLSDMKRADDDTAGLGFLKRIPQGAVIVLQFESDEEYNRWGRRVAEKTREEGRSLAFVEIRKLALARSRLVGPRLRLEAAA